MIVDAAKRVNGQTEACGAQRGRVVTCTRDRQRDKMKSAFMEEKRDRKRIVVCGKAEKERGLASEKADRGGSGLLEGRKDRIKICDC